MRFQTMLNSKDLFGARELAVAESFYDFGEFDCCAPLRDLDMWTDQGRKARHTFDETC